MNIHLLVDEKNQVIGAYTDEKMATLAAADRERRLHKSRRLQSTTYASIELVLELNAPVAESRL